MAANGTRHPKNHDDDSELVKVSLNLPRSVLRKVEALAQKTGFNKTTVIRRAIDIEAFLDEVRSRDGKFLVKEKGDELKEIIFR
jgi:predicted DNA-binding protein